MGLKRRLIGDDKFFLDYKKYMNELLQKDYARRGNETPTGKTWYIPFLIMQYTIQINQPKYLLCLIVVLNLKGSQ